MLWRIVCATIFDGCSGKRHMLWGRWFGVLELAERFVDIARHGQVNFAFGVVLVQCDANIVGAHPISINFVVLLEHSEEMLGVFFTNEFDAKVIDYQGELYGAPVMCPQSGN